MNFKQNKSQQEKQKIPPLRNAEKLFLLLCRQALSCDRDSEQNTSSAYRKAASKLSVSDAAECVEIIRKQKVDAFVRQQFQLFLEEFRKQPAAEKADSVCSQLENRITFACRSQILSNYYLWHESRRIIRHLEDAGVRTVLLKGAVTGSYYPEPECRKSGDIDLWIVDSDPDGIAMENSFGEAFEKAEEVMRQLGYEREEECHSTYHVAYHANGPEVELHGRLTGMLDEIQSNHLRAGFSEYSSIQLKEYEIHEGLSFMSLAPVDHAYYLLLHLLHHFLGKGFGWRLLIDWALVLKKEASKDFQKELLAAVKRGKIKTFAEICTLLCVKYLGLEWKYAAFLCGNGDNRGWRPAAIRRGADGNTKKIPEKKRILVRQLCREIFESGEFGSGDEARMVMPRKSGLPGLVSEFHLQMKRNHPTQSKNPLLWPWLWIQTLYVFLKNNLMVRKISSVDILRKASARASLSKELKLFRE